MALKDNGDLADSVLGQTNFTSGAPAAQRNGFWTPQLIDVFAGTLAVPDLSNSRCVLFGHAGHLPDGAPADTVLGKPFFTTGSPLAPTQGNMGLCRSVAFDAAGRLFVAEEINNRILRFDPPELAGNSFQPSVSGRKRKGRASYGIGNAGAFARRTSR